jgi:hypothetical protein
MELPDLSVLDHAANGAVRDRRAIPPRPEGRGFPRNWMIYT